MNNDLYGKTTESIESLDSATCTTKLKQWSTAQSPFIIEGQLAKQRHHQYLIWSYRNSKMYQQVPKMISKYILVEESDSISVRS